MPSPLLTMQRSASALAVLAVAALGFPAFAQRPIRPAPFPPTPGGSSMVNPPPMPAPPVVNPSGSSMAPRINPIPPPGLRMFQDVWYCEGCGQELSRGPNPPIGMRCPKCGAMITGADFNNGVHIGPNNPQPGNSVLPGASMPPAPFNPPPAASGVMPAPNYAPSPASPPGFAPGPGGAVGNLILGAVVVVLGAAVLAGATCLVIYNVIRNQAPARRRRRRFDEDDY